MTEMCENENFCFFFLFELIYEFQEISSIRKNFFDLLLLFANLQHLHLLKKNVPTCDELRGITISKGLKILFSILINKYQFPVSR